MVWGGEFGCEWTGDVEVSDETFEREGWMGRAEANLGLQLCRALGEPEYGG